MSSEEDAREVVSVFVSGAPQTFGDKTYEEPWKNIVAKEVRESCSSELPIENQVQVHLVFHLLKERRVDLDNLMKPCLDAIGSVLFKRRKGGTSTWDTNDHWVFKIIAEKKMVSKKSEEGVKIVISQLTRTLSL
jgi:Holliday junction resolvase RusA-like endonuclease